MIRCHYCHMNTLVSPIARERKAVYALTSDGRRNPEDRPSRLVCSIHLAAGMRQEFSYGGSTAVRAERVS